MKEILAKLLNHEELSREEIIAAAEAAAYES